MARRDRSEREDLNKLPLNKENLQKALQLFSFVGPNKWKFAVGMVFLLLTSATALGFPYLIGELIKAAKVSREAINHTGALLLGLFVLQAIFSFFRVYLFVDVTERMLAEVRKAVYDILIRMPMSYFSQRRVGELNSRISTDISQIQDTFTTNLAEFLRQFVVIIGGIFALFFTSGKLALAMLAVIPVVAVFTVIFGRYIRKQSRQVQDLVAKSNVIVEETFQGIHNVKAFANEFYENIRYGNAIAFVRSQAIKVGKVRGLFNAFIIFCLFGSIVGLVWYGAQLLFQGQMVEGDLVQFMLFTVVVGSSIGGIAEQYSQIQKTLGATDRVLEILNEHPENIETDKSRFAAFRRIRGEVKIENLAFAYPGRKDVQVLTDITLSANVGQKIAIVGPSGAGKSTLASMLLRFYEPDAGTIYIDGIPAHDMGLTELRSQIAIVPQDVILFGGTIRENILYGKPEATEEEMIAAAKKANAHDFITSFPEGYDAIVGDRGIKLSGGQRQRVAIARAVLKDPAVLILDEATSSLDSESEYLVQEALEKLMKGRTSFIIAHRLSTIRNADKIVVIDKGKVLEEGTHEELVQMTDGLYRKLSSMQFDHNFA